jgi:hypothetical protein
VAEVFAGFVAGFALSLITTPLLAFTLLSMRAGNGAISRLWPAEANLVAVSMVLHGFTAFSLTALGIVLGLVLLGMDGAASGAGSLNAPFTLFVAALVLAIFAPLVAIMAPLRRQLVAYALVTVIVYGWLMPYLADWSRFE